MNNAKPLVRLLPVLAGFYIMGFCDIVGIAASYAKSHFALSESVAGLIPSMVFLWFLLLSAPIAYWMNRTGRRKMVLAGYAVTFVGMLFPMVLYTFAGCLIAFALLGIGNTILQVALNPLLSNIVNGRALSSSLTAGQVIKAVSSFSGPFIMAFAASALGNWMWTFPIFAATTLIMALWLAITPIEETPGGPSTSVMQVFAELRDKKMLLFFGAIAAIVGIDVGINTLAPKLLAERCGLPLSEAGYGSSIYFFCRVAGAFIGTFLLTKISDKRYYPLHLLLGGVALVGLLFASDKLALILLLGTTGYAFSSIFSVIYSQALKHKPNKANEISGLMITGIFGGAVTPPLMGLLSDAFQSQAGPIVILILLSLYLLRCYPAIRNQKN